MKVEREMCSRVFDSDGLGLPVATRLTVCTLFFIVSFLTIDGRGGNGCTASSG
jgi:hypothetical protein